MGSRFKKEKEKWKETSWILEIAYIMRVHKDKAPFTKKMLISELAHMHPDLYHQDIKREIECALNDDKYFNKTPRFRFVKQGWWDLAERPD